MVFLPKDLVMSAEEAANMIKVAETDPYNEDWTPAFDARNSVLLKTNEKFTDSYDLYDNLGEGKFGKVYRCVEKSSKLELAAKCIRLKRDADKKQVEKEVSFMTRMHHRHIAQIYDAFATSNNEVVLIMEIVNGGELFDRVVEENYILTETAVAMIVYQICEAIRYIHSHNIIHLDLKPENIMCVSQTGNQIKLIDFGLAQYYDGEHDLLFMAGTPEFAAPEVIKFEPLDFHTDMWSVGVIVYILLSGESPFLGDNLALTYYNVERGLWEFCEEFDDNGVSEEAKDFINKLLILDKSKRMLPVDCLEHPWIVNHREKARQIALANQEDDSTKIDKTKLRTYVRNKNFRRLVFGVLFVNTIVRIFNTLKEKNSESGIQYVTTMLNAVNKEENSEKNSTISRKKKIIENEPGPSTVFSTEEIISKARRLDSGLGEGSTKVSALEEEEITIIEPPTDSVETFIQSSEFQTKNPEKSRNENITSKKIKKTKKISSKVSQDSALSSLPKPEAVQEDSEARDQMTELKDVQRCNSTTVSNGEVPKKKIIRKKKVPKPVLTLRDVEVPVVKYADEEKKIKKSKKKNPENSKNENFRNSKNENFENSKNSEIEEKKYLDKEGYMDKDKEENKDSSENIIENFEMAPIQALISRRRSSAEKRGGLVGNMLAKLEQKSITPVKFAISGVVPVQRKLPEGLPKPPLWTAACDVLKINEKNSKIQKIEKIQNFEIEKNQKNSNLEKNEISMKLEKKTTSEKKVSIKQKALRHENTVAEDNLQKSEKSDFSKCEFTFESKTKIEEGSQSCSNASKALFTKELKLKEKQSSEMTSSEITKIHSEKSIDICGKIGLIELKTENGEKISDRRVKLEEDEISKAIASGNVEAGAIVLQKKKIHQAEIVQDGSKTNTKIETKQKIVATTKPPKPSTEPKSQRRKSAKPKNRSLDDLLEEKSSKDKINLSKDILDPEEPKESKTLIHVKNASGNIGNANLQHESHVVLEKKNSDPNPTGNRKRSLLDPEEIEEIQAKERDAFNFSSLKNLLEQRVSGDPPVDEFEQWRRQKANEVAKSLRDSANVKRAMKKWISLDRQNQQ